MGMCPQRALTYTEEATVIIETAKAKLPCWVIPMPLAGSMHPVTLSGALVQGNAETLSAVVLSQLVKPGAPIVMTPWPGMMDMAAVTNVFGCPEQVLINLAFAQVAKYYRLPSSICVGQTDAKIPDQQAGYEKMMGILLAAMAGADVVGVFGGLIDSGKVGNYEQAVIDDEIAGYVKRILKGIEVTEEKLGIDVINEVGHGGNFLEHAHTLKYYREEQYFPGLSNRDARQRWEAEGSQATRERAIEKAKRILKEHRPDPLPNKIISELEKAVANIYKREGEEYRPFQIG
jgi:trimethylamine--corrinoid protein Co-methyltransferase